MKLLTQPAQSRAYKSRRQRSALPSAKSQGSWIITVITVLFVSCLAVSTFRSYIICPLMNNAATGFPHGKPLRFFPLLRLTSQIVQSPVLRPTSPSFEQLLLRFRSTFPAMTRAYAPALRPSPRFQLGRATRRLTVSLTAPLLSSYDPNCRMSSPWRKTRLRRESRFLPRRIGGLTPSGTPNVPGFDKLSRIGSTACVRLSTMAIGSSSAC